MSVDFIPNDHIDLGNWDLSGDTMTLSLWAALDTITADSRLIMKGVGTASDDHYWGMNMNGGNDRPQFRIHSGTLTSLEAPVTMASGVWYHLAGTYDGSTMRIYVNGVEENSTAKSGNLRTGAVDIWLGDQPGAAGQRPTDGRLEDVRVYDRTLSPQEIANIYHARGVDGIIQGGISRYRLNELAPGAVAAAVKDIWSRNNGTQTGDPVYAKGTTRASRRVA